MPKDKDVNLNEIDENFIIASFKNKDRRNNPSAEPRPLLPPEKETKEETKIRPTEKQEQRTNDTEQPIREEPKRKKNKAPDYESLFIQEVNIIARSGKSVYIRKEHHDKIMKIVRVIGKNEVSLFSYIDNVLSHHLSSYQEEITELYNKNNESIF